MSDKTFIVTKAQRSGYEDCARLVVMEGGEPIAHYHITMGQLEQLNNSACVVLAHRRARVNRLARSIGVVLLVAGGVTCVIFSIGVRILNPDMTETRLLLTYWPIYLAIVVTLFIGLMFNEAGR